MRHLTAVIYRGEDADLTLPIRLLKEEQIRWSVIDDVPRMLQLSDFQADPGHGWYVYFPAFRQGACTWAEIFRILDTRGLLLA